MFAFMSMKQQEAQKAEESSPNVATYFTPDIVPSDPSQQFVKLGAEDPFIAQEISNEDLIQARQGGISPEEQSEPFEEILESREMIEAKIFRIKCRMMEFVLRQ